jgi:phosphoribosylformylglycinamidine synthase
VSATRVAVLRFPGTLDHESAAKAVQAVGGEPVFTHHMDTALPEGATAVVIPGGFSYGDHLRPGALASRTPIMGAVKTHAAAGGRVLGICNGFQILCESGLLPGVLRPNASLQFICRQADLEVADPGTPWTGGRLAGEVLSVPFKHHDGAWFGDPGESRVVLRYKGENPNGSIDKIAGISNLAGNVMGLMPHPEEACDPLLGSVDGRALFAALLA